MSASSVTGDHRRGKTALFLIACGWAGVLPHWIESGPFSNLLPAITLAFFLGGYGLRTVLSDRQKAIANSNKTFGKDDCPFVDILVAARDEEAVVGRLVERLNSLRYPKHKLAIWMIDD